MSYISPRPEASDDQEIDLLSALNSLPVNASYAIVKTGATTFGQVALVGSDEKVKYDASDPTAGYLADKFVAGTGITLSEGAGADENKLKITNSGIITETDPLSLHLDQTTPQEIINGIPSYEESHGEFTDQYMLVDKEYVDEAVARIGASFYMLDEADDTVPTYKKTAMTASADATASVSASVDAVTDTLIEEWISPAGMDWTTLASGVYDLNVFAAKTAGNRTVRVFWRFYERKSDNSEVLIATSNLGNAVTTKERFRIYATLSTDYTPAVNSRLVGKVYFNTVGGSQNTTCVLYYRGTEDSHWEIPVSQEFLDDNYLTLNQTSAQTITASPVLDWLTASQLVATDANKKLQTLAVATYPSLAELSYVKGVTSAIQTQLATLTKNAPVTKTIVLDGDLRGLYAVSTTKKLPFQENGSGITITSYTVQCSVADPTTELNANIMWCDAQGTGAFPGANPTLLEVIDTTTGNYSSGAVTDAVATGKELYLLMDADPVDLATLWSITITYTIN